MDKRQEEWKTATEQGNLGDLQILNVLLSQYNCIIHDIRISHGHRMTILQKKMTASLQISIHRV